MTEKRYVSATETAKLIRRQLKKRHPDTKFSVRSDHDSINISWIDGPRASQVDDELCGFKGGGNRIEISRQRIDKALDGGS